MSEFIYLYRMQQAEAAPSAQTMQDRMQAWMAWMKSIEANIVSRGHPLAQTGGGVVKNGTFHDGPYAESKDIVVGFTIVRAKDLQEAMKLSTGCPILAGGGVVEVRPLMAM
jgi:hypothetical protein